MVGIDHDDSGDYGYDTVQEVKAALRLPTQRKRAPLRGVRGVPFERDPDADLGYDSAHEN